MNAPEKIEEIRGNTDITADVAIPVVKISPHATKVPIREILPTNPIIKPNIKPSVIGSPINPSRFFIATGSACTL